MNTSYSNQYDMSKPDSENQEKTPFAIGKILVDARASKGISLNEASDATKLKKGYLEAIENDNFDLLPAAIYAKNFIRIYANYLGLDGSQIADDFGASVTVKTELPEKTKTVSTYYVASALNIVIRHKYITLLVILFLIIFISLYSGTSSKKKQAANVDTLNNIDPSNTDAFAFVQSYTPVTDMKEPLPEYK